MSESTAPQSNRDSDPNFVRVRRDVITEDNWPEYEANGFVFLENQEDPSNATRRSSIEREERQFGAENIYTGHSFDLDEGRPLAHKPGLGIYVGPGADQMLVEETVRSREAEQRQASSEGGPASN